LFVELGDGEPAGPSTRPRIVRFGPVAPPAGIIITVAAAAAAAGMIGTDPGSLMIGFGPSFVGTSAWSRSISRSGPAGRVGSPSSAMIGCAGRVGSSNTDARGGGGTPGAVIGGGRGTGGGG
jgi:hypothetical protein